MRRTKYRAVPTYVGKIRFASKKEAARYVDLKLLERSGKITGLKLQPKFPLVISGVKICTYIPDYLYQENDTTVVEDVKGVKTPVYRIKKKLFEVLYAPLTITEV